MSMTVFQEAAMAMVAEARASVMGIGDGLPDKAETEGQKAMAAKSGTPKAFAQGLISVIGEISPDEARAAAANYLAKWLVA
jgi:hypothetical protein